jgi:hypothetical protein
MQQGLAMTVRPLHGESSMSLPLLRRPWRLPGTATASFGVAATEHEQTLRTPNSTPALVIPLTRRAAVRLAFMSMMPVVLSLSAKVRPPSWARALAA